MPDRARAGRGGAQSLCDADVQKQCPAVRPGAGRIILCVKAHYAAMSEPCKVAIGQAAERVARSLTLRVNSVDLGSSSAKADIRIRQLGCQELSSSPSFGHLNSVSAVPPIPDITATDRSTYALCQELKWARSFYDVIRPQQQRLRKSQTKLFRSLEIDR
jgi:hypothetical protein